RAPPTATLRSRVAVRVRGSVAALEPHLVRAFALERHEEVGIHRDPALLLGVDLGKPAADAVGIELRVPRRVERVRQVDASAVPADLDHLRAAVELATFGVRRARDDSAQAHRSGEARTEGVADVVLAEFARSPAGHVEELGV